MLIVVILIFPDNQISSVVTVIYFNVLFIYFSFLIKFLVVAHNLKTAFA